MKKIAELKLELFQDETHYRVLFTDTLNQKHAALESDNGNIQDTPVRRSILDRFFSNIPQIIRQYWFPRDTRVFDMKDTPTGRIATNPHYPK